MGKAQSLALGFAAAAPQAWIGPCLQQGDGVGIVLHELLTFVPLNEKGPAMAKIETLLLAGANNHDWTRSAPFCKKVLEDSGKFAVTLTEDPSTALEDAEALARYDLLFSDYNGPDWSDMLQSWTVGIGIKSTMF